MNLDISTILSQGKVVIRSVIDDCGPRFEVSFADVEGTYALGETLEEALSLFLSEALLSFYNSEKQAFKGAQLKTSEAFEVLKQAMKDDPDLAHGWHSNIAMAFYDECDHVSVEPCHRGATRFMKSCFDVKTSMESA